MKTNLIFLAILSLFHEPASSRRTTDKPGVKSARVGPKWNTLHGDPTVFMAHRGEKVLLPEHTQGSYEFAAIEGADFVEPDLVFTSDGQLVCFHDLTLKDGTDVSLIPEFANRTWNYTGIIDEDPVSIINDWFILNFTLAELKKISITQRSIGIRPQYFNGMFNILTFEEYLETIHSMAYKLKKPIGIIPELKHPRLHNEVFGPDYMEDQLLETLTKYGYPLATNQSGKCTSPKDNNAAIECGHLIIQSFDLDCLKNLHNRTSADKMMLIDTQLRYLTYKGLEDIAPYATFYSLWKELLNTGILPQIDSEGIEYDKDVIEKMGGFISPKEIVSEAHKRGLKVGLYTIYDSREPSQRGCMVECEPENKEMELNYYFDMGVDGMFVENVPEAREIRFRYEHQMLKSSANAIFSLNSYLTLAVISKLFAILFYNFV